MTDTIVAIPGKVTIAELARICDGATLTLGRDEATSETVARIVMPFVPAEERARPRVHAS